MILDFHGLVAQVIPVLFLAAAFESRWLTAAPHTYSEQQRNERRASGDEEDEKGRVSPQSNISQSYARIWLILLMVIGETAALHTVLSSSASSLGTSLAIIGLSAGTLVIVFPLVALHASDIRSYITLIPGQWWWHLLILASLIMVTVEAIYLVARAVNH